MESVKRLQYTQFDPPPLLRALPTGVLPPFKRSILTPISCDLRSSEIFWKKKGRPVHEPPTEVARVLDGLSEWF